MEHTTYWRWEASNVAISGNVYVLRKCTNFIPQIFLYLAFIRNSSKSWTCYKLLDMNMKISWIQQQTTETQQNSKWDTNESLRCYSVVRFLKISTPKQSIALRISGTFGFHNFTRTAVIRGNVSRVLDAMSPATASRRFLDDPSTTSFAKLKLLIPFNNKL